MQSWVALLRGINVGGHRKLPMAELKALMEGLGCKNVRHTIQSGNVVFRAQAPSAEAVAAAIEGARGFRPQVMILSGGDFAAIAEANPFPEGLDDPKTLHVYFLSRPPRDDAEARLREAAGPTERFSLGDRVLYLHSLDYLSGSNIAQRAESLLGVPATARNWNTVTRVCAMLGES